MRWAEIHCLREWSSLSDRVVPWNALKDMTGVPVARQKFRHAGAPAADADVEATRDWCIVGNFRDLIDE